MIPAHALVLALVLAAASPAAASANGRDPGESVPTPMRTVTYSNPEHAATSDGGTRLTYVGRLDGEDLVHVVLEIPPGWTFHDETIPIRVKGTCVNDVSGTSVHLVTQIDRDHFCNTHVAAHVVREDERRRIDEFVLSGLEVSFLDPRRLEEDDL